MTDANYLKAEKLNREITRLERSIENLYKMAKPENAIKEFCFISKIAGHVEIFSPKKVQILELAIKILSNELELYKKEFDSL